MDDQLQINPVARIKSEFPTKFGIPRQAGLVPELRGRVVFEPPFRSPEALRGMDGFSHDGGGCRISGRDIREGACGKPFLCAER